MAEQLTSISLDFFLRFGINLISLIVLSVLIYYPRNGRSQMVFAIIGIGLAVFMVGTLLDRLTLDFGFAIGLFALFSIIRFRSSSLEIKDITYIFLAVGIAIISALFNVFVASVASTILVLGALFLEFAVSKLGFEWRELSLRLEDSKMVNDMGALKKIISDNTGYRPFKVKILKLDTSKNSLQCLVLIKK